MSQLYVASSWRNERYPAVVEALRAAGHSLYDFRNPSADDHGFSWTEVEPAPKPWDAATLRRAHRHARSLRAFDNDFRGMRNADGAVLVLPCGKSAHLEAGRFAGAHIPLVVFMPEPTEPELMYLLAGRLRIVERVEEISPALAELGVRP